MKNYIFTEGTFKKLEVSVKAGNSADDSWRIARIEVCHAKGWFSPVVTVSGSNWLGGDQNSFCKIVYDVKEGWEIFRQLRDLMGLKGV